MPQKILIADDDERIRCIIRLITAGLVGGTIYEASNGAEAIEICTAHQPDWVLLDIHMRPMDGFQALLEIRARFPEIRVVIVSQDDDAALRAKALRAGACAYVLKENLYQLQGILKATHSNLLPEQSHLQPSGSNIQTGSTGGSDAPEDTGSPIRHD